MAELRTHTQLIGRASDLGAGGCYIDTLTPFPVGASIMLNLTSENHNIRAKAAVIYAHTGMGMGLAFTEIAADQRETLKAWLRELSGDAPQEQPASANLHNVSEPTTRLPGAAAKSAAALDALQELVSLLRNKGLLNESEVDLLRNKMEK